MINRKAAENKAMDIIESRRSRARLAEQEHIAEIALKHPEINQYRQDMAQTASSLVKAVVSGEASPSAIEQLKQHNLFAQKQIKELLNKNGYPSDYLKPAYHCSLCCDTGFHNGKKCSCFNQLTAEILFGELSKDCGFEEYSFDNFLLDYYPGDLSDKDSPKSVMSYIYDYCKDYAEKFCGSSASIFMFGATGLGKTHLALAIAGKAAKKGYGVVFGTAQDLMRKIENEHFGKSRTESDTLSELIEAQLLVIDDLGSEFSSEFNSATVYNIVNSRNLKKLPTVITSNLSAKEIENKYSARVVSRIFSSYVCLRFKGNDVRIEKVRKRNGH